MSRPPRIPDRGDPGLMMAKTQYPPDVPLRSKIGPEAGFPNSGTTAGCTQGFGTDMRHRYTQQEDMPESGGGIPLFVDDDELRRRINPKMGRQRFRSTIRAVEAKFPDFPKIHALWRGRYWPAVKQWLDDENGPGKHAPVSAAQDGSENFDVPAQR
jgi:hypothetical protein